MAIRLTPDQILKAAFLALLLAWAALLATGCVPIEVKEPTFTGVDVSKTSTTAVPVSIADVQGDVWAFTVVGATPWTIAGLVGLLGLFQARRRSTATGALDRVMGTINDRHAYARKHENVSDAMELKALKGAVASYYECGQHGEIIIDRHERCIRSRLARMET